jgi:hypothetical protein
MTATTRGGNDDVKDTSSDIVMKYLTELQMDNIAKWLHDVDIHDIYDLYTPLSDYKEPSEQSSDSELISLLDEDQFLPSSLAIEHPHRQNLLLIHVPFLVSPLLDQNHLRDALYWLMAITPASVLNDDVIGIYGERCMGPDN